MMVRRVWRIPAIWLSLSLSVLLLTSQVAFAFGPVGGSQNRSRGLALAVLTYPVFTLAGAAMVLLWGPKRVARHSLMAGTVGAFLGMAVWLGFASAVLRDLWLVLQFGVPLFTVPTALIGLILGAVGARLRKGNSSQTERRQGDDSENGQKS